MDDYIESISPHKLNAKNKSICIVAVIVGLLLSCAAFLFFDWYTIFIVFGISYLAYRIVCSQYYEFEYVLDADSFSVYKIVNKSSRKRLLCVSPEKIISLAPYHGEPLSGAFLDAAGTEEGRMLLKLSGNGQPALLFSPNEKMTAALEKILKRY